MDALTINEAAQTSGWSPRMLRYIEGAGLLELPRSAGGYRLYGPAQLQRLRTLRELLAGFDFGLADLGFARRLRSEPRLASAVEEWFETEPARRRARRGRRLAALGAGEAPGADRRRHRRHQRPTGGRMTGPATLTAEDFKVADLALAEFGRNEIRLAQHEMPG